MSTGGWQLPDHLIPNLPGFQNPKGLEAKLPECLIPDHLPMKIRSITCFLNPGWPLDENLLQRCGEFVSAARPAFEGAGYEVQTSRLATVPFPSLLAEFEVESLVRLAVTLERAAKQLGLGYVSLGPASPANLASYAAIPPVLAATEMVFLAGLMTTPAGEISLSAVRACAEVIHQAGTISPDGFANLRFAALANVPGGEPFFPAAYCSAEKPAFALALEPADLAVQAAASSASLAGMRSTLIVSIESHAARLSAVADELARQTGFSFDGLDFTLAPFPLEDRSIGTALERLGVPAVGLHGSLAGIAFLADTLDRADFRRAGFNGVFFPVLEDTILARRAAEGLLTIKDLLLFSTVCGTGLDTLPLPGDISVEQIYALLLDLAALALRLDKPLTARLMPIPGKQAGDPIGFDFAFFSDSRVMPVQAEPLNRMLAGNENIKIDIRGRGK